MHKNHREVKGGGGHYRKGKRGRRGGGGTEGGRRQNREEDVPEAVPVSEDRPRKGRIRRGKRRGNAGRFRSPSVMEKQQLRGMREKGGKEAKWYWVMGEKKRLLVRVRRKDRA